ncbi:hypothetical protein COCHEDRAFT_1019030, partial [Bipolaris maydis C5]
MYHPPNQQKYAQLDATCHVPYRFFTFSQYIFRLPSNCVVSHLARPNIPNLFPPLCIPPFSPSIKRFGNCCRLLTRLLARALGKTTAISRLSRNSP